MFFISSPCLLGQRGSCSTAQQCGELSENSLQNLRNKWPPHPVICSDCNESTPLYSPTSDEFDLITRRLSGLMEEGRGEAIYDVGVPLVDSDENGTADGAGGGAPTEGLVDAGTNCIKIGLPGKLILSKRKGLWEFLFSWK